MASRKRSAILVGLPIALLLVAYVGLRDYVRGAAFVVKAAGMQGIARTAAEWEAGDVVEEPAAVPWRGGTLAARRYRPAGGSDRVFLLVPGVHASGVDEPRLIGFARDLASMGHAVVTIGPPDLARYMVTPETTDAIEDAALWLASQPDLAPDGRIVMMGISFAGGLSVVAAGRERLKDKVAAVVSLGGHGDLPRTLRYLCTGIQPDGTRHPPHDYGVVIILLAVADRVVPPDQVETLRSAVLMFLEASRLDLIDKAESAATFKRVVDLETTLPEPTRTLMRYVNQRDVGSLGTILLPHVSGISASPALSPSASPPPAAPVFLLHGAGDNVIPAAESIVLGRELVAHGATANVLATPLITHAEVDRAPHAGDVWRLVLFWSNVLGQ